MAGLAKTANRCEDEIKAGAMPNTLSQKMLARKVAEQQRRITELTETQNLLWESVKKYRTIVESSPDAIAVVKDGNVQFINTAFTRLLGYTGDDLDSGINFFDLIQDFDRDAVYRQFERHMDKGQWSVLYRTDLMPKSGTQVPCEISVKRIDEDGIPAELLVIRSLANRSSMDDANDQADGDLDISIRDRITSLADTRELSQAVSRQRSAGEKVLRPSREEGLLLLEASPDPIVAYDLEGNAIYVSPSFTKVFGWTPDELIGKRIDFVPDENWPETSIAIEKIMQGENILAFDTRRVTKDDRVLDIQLSACLYYHLFDRPAGIIAILRDVTELKKVEKALRQSEEKFRHLVETMNNGLCIQDQDGLIIYVNKKLQDLIGYSKKELVGRPLIEFLDEAGKLKLKQAAADFASGDWQRFDLNLTCKDGHKISMLISPAPLLDAKGRVRGSFAVMTDITNIRSYLRAFS